MLTPPQFVPLIARRLGHAGVDVSDDVIAANASYLALLARWNARINLTAFNLGQPTDDAIDRLIVEPLSAARFVDRSDEFCVDIGSGGGSPALPFKLGAPHLRMALIEARVRKSAFLREAVRALSLNDVRVETTRFDRRWDVPGFNQVDVVTMRAVRADQELWGGLRNLIRPGGRLFWFVDLVASPILEVDQNVPSGWSVNERLDGQHASLAILKRLAD